MTLRRRLRRLVAGTAIVAVSVALVATWVMARSAARGAATERLAGVSALLADSLADAGPGADLHALSDQWSKSLQVRVSVIDRTGTVLADSTMGRDNVALLGDHDGRPEIVDARAEGLGTALRYSQTLGEESLYVARSVPGSGGLVLRVSLPASALRPGRALTPGRVIVALGAGLVLLLLASGWLAARRAKPVEQLARAARSIAGGDLEMRVPRGAADEEHQRLAAAVDRLRVRVDDLQRERGRDEWLLSTIVHGMREGLLIVDDEQRVVAANDALRGNLSSGLEPVGRLQSEVFRHPDVIRTIESALSTGDEVRQRVDDRAQTGRVFDLQVSPLRRAEGEHPHAAVALFYDVTRLETLESVRQTFVADVSHELRTPLTSIKAAVETLQDDDSIDRERAGRFLEMIERHSRRMEMLVDDLSDLSRIETGSIELVAGPVDVHALARRIADDFSEQAQEIGVTVTNEVPEGFVVHADPRRLDQILVNLVDNAVKFNRPGGGVRIRGEQRGGEQFVEVVDTGIGIPSESAERVFHRFFRVDVARSRESGGTGLGLAIVKHLMQLHGGRVQVDSRLGEGSRFTLVFARQPVGRPRGSDA